MKFVYGILVFLALAVAALFLVPSFLNWEGFKPEITERLEAITGRTLAIDGPLKVSILPTPKIEATDLRLANVPGAASPDMARIKSLDLRLALGPLLSGEIAVTGLAIDEPVIELQRLADGGPNWLFEGAPGPATDGDDAERADSGLELTRLDSTTITNGAIVYRHVDGRPPERIEGIDATLSARTLDGPFRGEGTFTVRGRPVAFQLATSTLDNDGTMPISVEAVFGGERGRALFEGTVRGNGDAPAFDGNVRLEAADFGALLSELDVDLGALPTAPLATEFDAKAVLSLNAEAIGTREIQLRLGESQASGALSWQDGDVPRLIAEIDLNRFDLDQFLPVEGAPVANGTGQSVEAPPLAALQTVSDDIREAIPGDIAAAVDLKIGTLTWRKGVIRQARTQLALADGTVAIQQASALLPGGTQAQFAGSMMREGDGPWLDGSAEIAADDLRAVLTWLGADVGDVPADRLRILSASADLSAQGNRLSASNLDVRVDTTRIAGNAAIAAGGRLRVTAALAADTVNLDAYLPAADNAAGGSPAVPVPETAGNGAWAGLADVDANVLLQMDALIYDGVRLAGLELSAALDGGDLTLRRASVENAVGASVSVAGTGRALRTAPHFDLTVEGAADSLEGVAALLDIDPDIRTEAFGKVALKGSVAGGEDALTLDLDLAAGTAVARLQGTVDEPLGTPSGALALSLRAPDAAALARTVGLTPPAAVGRIGALAVDGGIGGDLGSIAINLNAETAGATVTVSGTVTDLLESPGYDVDVDLAHPSGETLVEAVIGEAAGANLGAVRLAGKVSGDLTVANLAGIDAAIGESTLTGDIFLRLDQEPPEFHANLQAGTFDLAWVGGGLAATDGDLGAGIEVAELESERWSEEPIDLALLDRLSGTLALDAGALVLGPYRIEQADVDLSASEGTLTLRSLEGRLFGGALKADGSLAGGAVPSGQGAVRLVDADIGAILRETAGGRAFSGHATIDGYFTLSGQTEREMVESLTGRVAISGGEGVVEGVDVPAISGQIAALSTVDALDDVLSFVEQAEQSLSSGQTAIRSLDGTVWVQNGQARIDGLKIVADGAHGDVSGTADLPAWQLDLTALFRLAEHADAPPVGVRLEGPIDWPERRYLIEDMQAHLVKLGLLSLAGSDEVPKITLRKGAKGEPGTEIDTLLRNVLGDPDEAEDAGPAEEPAEAREGAGETGKAAEIRDKDDPGSALLSLDDVPANPAVVEEPLDADHLEEPADPDPTEQPEEPVEIEEDEQPAAASAPKEPAPKSLSDGTVPEPPSAPERYRGETLQDFVDDLLGEPEPEEAVGAAEEEENQQDFADELLEEPEREDEEKEGEENLQNFVDDLLKTLDE
ncbi:MAG: AsmA family protein [Rhodospirillaceae bacterium]|nr:AsmA family protein [Rhodospirillaceae bacterium]